MQATASRIETLLTQTTAYLLTCPEEVVLHRPAPGKWSKQEILGHLIDSALNNLKRFTEAQTSTPYQVVRYPQDELVRNNQYQQARLRDLLALWTTLNRHISFVVSALSPEALAHPIALPDGTATDLAWLVRDYVVHLEHHAAQITQSEQNSA